MKRVTILVTLNTADATQLYEQFKEYIPKGVPSGNIHQLPLIADSKEAEAAIRFSEEHFEIKPSLFQEVYYTKKELEEVPFFQVHLGDPLEFEGCSADEYGTQYSGQCAVCKCGGEVAGDVLVDRKFMKNYRIGVLPPSFFVSDELKQIIENAGLTGVSFSGEVKDFKGREMPRKFHVLKIHHILPPLDVSTWLEYSMPAACGHCLTYLRSNLQYEQEKLKDALDFNLTHECLNNDKAPMLIVSAKVRKLFLANKVTRVHFLPIVAL